MFGSGALVLLKFNKYKIGLNFFVPVNLQGTLTAIRDWFRDYKIPDGKPANKFGLGNKPADKVWCNLNLKTIY